MASSRTLRRHVNKELGVILDEYDGKIILYTFEYFFVIS